MTVEKIIDGIIRKTGLTPLPPEQTCDKLMAGHPEQDVSGIVSTFMATVEVIEKTIETGANFIITHEPTWFTGKDDEGWLENDPVYIKKKKLIEENNLAIWRFHDYMHIGAEDGIYRGFDKEFGWDKYRMHPNDIRMPGQFKDMDFGGFYKIPATTLRELSLFFKERLEMDVIQIVGKPEMAVERVAVLVGGGSLGLGFENMPMQLMHLNQIDVVVCGDITEWTLSAYVRDAADLGFNKGMLVLGHERSEEPGMKHLDEWLSDIVGNIKINFIDSGEPFKYFY